MIGFTIDDSWYGTVEIGMITDALRAIPTRPTVRIVMSPDKPVEAYRELFKAISPVAEIMAEPVDSYYMHLYQDRESYLERFRATYEVLGTYVDIWEIGNEINGTDWIQQDPALIIEKTQAANDFIKSCGGKTALTLYYAHPEEQDLFSWLSRYLSSELCEIVDYALISYYEDDHSGYLPDWRTVFPRLESVFPNAKVGIGECGNTAEDATAASKIAMAEAYYGMARVSERFIGGFFWWNWVQDCVPHNANPVYHAINRIIEKSQDAETAEEPRK